MIVARLPAPRVTLRAAATDADRNGATEAWLQSVPPVPRAIVAEGVLLDRLALQDVPLVGLGAVCPCCTGLSVLRVVLARTLRRLRPEALLVLVAIEEHLPRLRRMLEDGELGVRFEVEA